MKNFKLGTMKKYIILFALAITTIIANAQTEDTIPVLMETPEQMQEDLQQVLKPTYGDYYEGLSKKITFDRMIPPYGLEVTFDKTVCAHKGE
jgi:hypothetical protein